MNIQLVSPIRHKRRSCSAWVTSDQTRAPHLGPERLANGVWSQV